MKMTMHIDDEVLRDVMELTGTPTKTAAVEMALQELVRRRRLSKALQELAAVPAEELAAGHAFRADHDSRMKHSPTPNRPVRPKRSPAGKP